MINNGVPDDDILNAWLTDLHFGEYFNLFISAGYDMPTISRMTPEDLTAIGIQNPAHRKKLKTEISKWNISDGLPEYIPGSLEEWLKLLRLEEYHGNLISQGYTTIQQVATINIEDLEDTGFYRLGHQKRLVLAIRRIKELSRGNMPVQPNITMQPPLYQTQGFPLPSGQSIASKHGGFSLQHPESHSVTSSPFASRKSKEPSNIEFSPAGGYQPQRNVIYNTGIPQIQRHKQQLSDVPPNVRQSYSDGRESPALIPDPMPPMQYPSIYTHSAVNSAMQFPGSPRLIPRTAGGQSQQPPAHQAAQKMTGPGYRLMQRSYDDADILNHAEHSVLVHNSSDKESGSSSRGGTLPRLKAGAGSGGLVIQQRPVARIVASSRQHNRDCESDDVDCINICDTRFDMSKCKSGTSSPNMTLRRSVRSGSDAGIQLKRNTSFDSDSGSGLPFANDNAGTIRMRSNSNILPQDSHQQTLQFAPTEIMTSGGQKRNAGDVLQDIGSMLSDLTDELDAMLKFDRGDQ